MMHWEIQQGSDVSGPFSEDEILMMVEAGRIDADTMVRPEGKQAWKPATRHGRFAAALRAAAAIGGTGGAATTAGSQGDAGAGPDTTRSRRAPIDGLPYKDPARWDQQTQLGMPVATVLPGGVPAAMAAATSASGGGGRSNGAGATNGAATGPAVGGPPPLPAASQAASAADVAPAAVRVVSAPHAAPAAGPIATRDARANVAARGVAGVAAPARGGVVSGLFDFGFTTFITARLARVLYALHVIMVLAAFVVGCVVGVGAVQTALRLDSQTMLLAGVAQLLATPIVCLCALVIGRVVAESVVVFFRVAEHLGEIDRKTPG